LVSAAGTVHHLSLEEIRGAITELAIRPGANTYHELVDADPAQDKSRKSSRPLANSGVGRIS